MPNSSRGQAARQKAQWAHREQCRRCGGPRLWLRAKRIRPRQPRSARHGANPALRPKGAACVPLLWTAQEQHRTDCNSPPKREPATTAKVRRAQAGNSARIRCKACETWKRAARQIAAPSACPAAPCQTAAVYARHGSGGFAKHAAAVQATKEAADKQMGFAGSSVFSTTAAEVRETRRVRFAPCLRNRESSGQQSQACDRREPTLQRAF